MLPGKLPGVLPGVLLPPSPPPPCDWPLPSRVTDQPCSSLSSTAERRRRVSLKAVLAQHQRGHARRLSRGQPSTQCKAAVPADAPASPFARFLSCSTPAPLSPSQDACDLRVNLVWKPGERLLSVVEKWKRKRLVF